MIIRQGESDFVTERTVEVIDEKEYYVIDRQRDQNGRIIEERKKIVAVDPVLSAYLQYIVDLIERRTE